jgi:hypothetical protein
MLTPDEFLGPPPFGRGPGRPGMPGPHGGPGGGDANNPPQRPPDQ